MRIVDQLSWRWHQQGPKSAIFLASLAWLKEDRGTDYYCTRCLSSPNICYKFWHAYASWRKISAMFLVSAITPYNVSNSLTESKTYACLTKAWPGRESDASVRHVLSKRNIRVLRKMTCAIRDLSENREHKFTLRKHEDRHLVQ